MNIHEYQAKVLLKRYSVVVPRGEVAFSPEEASNVASGLAGGQDTAEFTIKSPKSAGIHIADSSATLGSTMLKHFQT